MNASNVADLITIESGKRGDQPCIRGLRITVRDVLVHLAGGMTVPELLDEFSELTAEDVRACFAFAADLLHRSEGPKDQSIIENTQELPVNLAKEIEIQAAPDSSMGWMQPIIGILADEPAFEEVLAYGRAYRDAGRPAQDEDR